jgi:hypothetical protein
MKRRNRTFAGLDESHWRILKIRWTMMKRCRVIVGVLVVSGLCVALLVAVEGKNSVGGQRGEVSKLVGSWSGESVCVDKEKFPACRDEQVVYRIVESSGKANMVTVTMDKIVGGKPETMGVLDFVYDAQKQTLSGEFERNNRRGIWEFTVRGDALEGTLATLPERTIARRVKVKKDKLE